MPGPQGSPSEMKGPSEVSPVAETQPGAGRSSRDRALFDRIASSYARKDLYEPSRTARIARLRRTLELGGLAPDTDVLEVGCGAGFAARYLEGACRSYTGIDYSEALIGYAVKLDAGPGAVFHAADLYEWHPEERYDLIFAIGVLHHMPDIPRAMTSMLDLLEPGGALVVNEPQPANALFHGLRRVRAVLDSAYSGEQEELSESDLVGFFRDAGFVDIRTRAQGLLSTPFAEVMLRPRALARPLSALCCRIDAWLERRMQRVLRPLAWNVVVAGRRPPAHESPADVD